MAPDHRPGGRGAQPAPKQRGDIPATDILPAAEIVPWRETRVAVKPYSDMWCFNPSIHFDGETWRMIVRCADYAMPDGIQIRGPNADANGVQTRNVMLHLDPTTLRPVEVFPMRELDGLPRNRAGVRGFEDLRLFHTELWGLQAIACSAHLERHGSLTDHYPPEQVVLSLDEDDYSIIAAQPIRGEAWSGPQKNWSPFDQAEEPRFLFSIERGMVFGMHGPIEIEEPVAEPEPITPDQLVAAVPAATKRKFGPLPVNGVEYRQVARMQAVEAKQIGRKHFGGLRGGTQLVYIADNEWLSLAHEARIERNRKFYWHTFYTCDSNGKLLKVSPPMKLVPEKIEFAAGLVVDGDRVVVSLGVDDAQCAIGTTSLEAVMATMKPAGDFKEQPLPAPVPRRLTVGTSSTPIRKP